MSSECPRLEIGNSSVTPWARPITTACRQLSTAGPPGGVRFARFNGHSRPSFQQWSGPTLPVPPTSCRYCGRTCAGTEREVSEVVNGALLALVVAVVAVMLLGVLYVGGFLG